MRRLLSIGVLAGLVPMLGGCASASAKAQPADVPALTVPPAPPRVIEPPPAPESTPEPVGDLPTAPATPSRAPRREPAKPVAEPKTEPKTEPPATEPPPPTAPPPQPAVPQLSTPQTADSSEAARAIRATIDRARATLSSVNYNAQSNERKKAYNDVKMFLEQAENAVKQGNYTFAQGMAAKAETLARELAGR